MGKVTRQKYHGIAARTAADSGTAVSAKDIHPPTLASTGGTTLTDIQASVLDGLTSLNHLTRESSCAAIASLFEKVDCPEAGSEAWAAAQRLIAGGVVKKLLPRLVDRAPEVKLQATGAIRNISAVRDPRVCEVMVKDDCLTPVLTLLHRTSTNQNGGAISSGAASHVAAAYKTSKTAGQVQTPNHEETILTQLVATLCNLLAAVDVAVERFTRQGGLEVVMRLLLAEGCRGNAEIFSGALQALHVATDSNPELVNQLTAMPGAIDQLAALATGAGVVHVQVSPSMCLQAAGVLVNVASCLVEGRLEDTEAELGRVVLPLLLEQMQYNPASLERACAALAASREESGGEGMEVDGLTNINGTGSPDGSKMEAEDPMSEYGARVAAAVTSATPMQITTNKAVNSNGNQAGKKTNKNNRPTKTTKEDSESSEEQRVPINQPDKDAEIRWGWKLSVAEPLKLTAEVMTNMCAFAAENNGRDEEEDKEWGSDDEDIMEQAARSASQGDTTTSPMGESTVLLNALANSGALQRTTITLKALLAPTPRDHSPTSEGHNTVTGKLGESTDSVNRLPLPSGTAGDLADLRATVALCAANLVQNLPVRALGTDPHLLWLDLCNMCEAAVERSPSCVETLTGVMWGLVRRVGPAVVASMPATATGRSIRADPPLLLLRLCDPEKTRSFEARVNAVGMLGALGMASLSSAVGTGGTEVGLERALVQALEDPHVLVQAEALNAIMDIFGDDNQDAAYHACGAPSALASGVPAFRRKVKQEGKALGRDALCHLKETALNAGRFVKYKHATGGSAGGIR